MILRPRNLFDLLLQVLLRALDIHHRRVQRVMPHDLREPMQGHHRRHPIAKAMAMDLPLVHLLSLNIRQLLLLEVCSRMPHVRHICDTLVIGGRHAVAMLCIYKTKEQER